MLECQDSLAIIYVSSNAEITTKIVTKRNRNDRARTNPGARPPTTQKQKPKQQPREQRKRQPKQQQKRKPNDHARIQPLSKHRTATKIAPEKKDQDDKKYSNQSCKKNRNHNDHAHPGPGNNPSLLDKTIVLGPQNEVRKAYQKLAP